MLWCTEEAAVSAKKDKVLEQINKKANVENGAGRSALIRRQEAMHKLSETRYLMKSEIVGFANLPNSSKT